MKSSEVVIQKRNTLALIQADSRMVAFHRATKSVVLPNGGTSSLGPHTLDPQMVRKVSNKFKLLKPADRSTTAGFMERHTERLIALADADIRKGDTFEYDGNDYEVTLIVRKQYQVTAEVELRGDAQVRD